MLPNHNTIQCNNYEEMLLASTVFVLDRPHSIASTPFIETTTVTYVNDVNNVQALPGIHSKNLLSTGTSELHLAADSWTCLPSWCNATVTAKAS